jgi:type II secretory pathway pseudopilin PulG
MSLIEALIAVAISVLIATIAMPSMNRAMEAGARATAGVALVADLRAGRADAIRFARPVSLTISQDGRRYRIGRSIVDLPGASRLQAANDARLTFYPDGSSTGARLALGDLRLRVAPATGLVSQASILSQERARR